MKLAIFSRVLLFFVLFSFLQAPHKPRTTRFPVLLWSDFNRTHRRNINRSTLEKRSRVARGSASSLSSVYLERIDNTTCVYYSGYDEPFIIPSQETNREQPPCGFFSDGRFLGGRRRGLDRGGKQVVYSLDSSLDYKSLCTSSCVFTFLQLHQYLDKEGLT